ncbi:nitrile hydratase subunit beta [Paraburkholderia sp. EG287A]|uniref:nitrile hydratase subunit beta n=1 Tax=unclassified Paraburkholderia TaxID=2615204 RepID=UPI0034D28FAC
MTYHSHADLGGKPGLGAILLESDGKVFHADWEGRTHALTLSMMASRAFNIDMGRRARETLADYAGLSYYQIWFAALVGLLIENGLVEEDELAACRMLHPPMPLTEVLHAAGVPALVSKTRSTHRQLPSAARFKVGETVRTHGSPVPHHTRLPAYARGKVGCIEQIRGAHIFADAHAHGLGEDPQWLYSVVFDGRELWGGDASCVMSVALDAWEPYLETLP